MSEQIETLLELYIRGEASSTQEEQLREAIEQDPRLLKDLHREALFDCDLSHYFSKANTEDLMHRVVKKCGVPKTRSFRKRSQQRRKRKHALQLIPLAVAAMLLVALSIVLVLDKAPSDHVVVVSKITGRASVYHINDSLESVAVGDQLPFGARVWVGSNSEAVFTYADGSKLLVMPDSRLEFHRINGAKVILVDSGHIHADVKKQEKGYAMQLRSQHAELTVIGTSFDFRVSAHNSKLDVSEGMVRYGNKIGDQTMVSAGESAQIGDKGEIKTIARPKEIDAPYHWRFNVGAEKPEDWFAKVIPGSRSDVHAFRAVLRDGGQHHTIRSGDYWHEPRFRVHADSVIRMRMRLERNGFWHIFMLVQEKSASMPNAIMELKPKLPRQYKVGEWIDLEFALKDIDVAVRSGGEEDLPLETINGHFCFAFFLDSQVKDLGLSMESFEIYRAGEQR